MKLKESLAQLDPPAFPKLPASPATVFALTLTTGWRSHLPRLLAMMESVDNSMDLPGRAADLGSAFLAAVTLQAQGNLLLVETVNRWQAGEDVPVTKSIASVLLKAIGIMASDTALEMTEAERALLAYQVRVEPLPSVELIAAAVAEVEAEQAATDAFDAKIAREQALADRYNAALIVLGAGGTDAEVDAAMAGGA